MLALMVLIAVAPGTLRRVPFITDPAQLVKIAVIAYIVLLTLFALGSGVRRHSKRALGMHADTILSVAFAPNGELCSQSIGTFKYVAARANHISTD